MFFSPWVKKQREEERVISTRFLVSLQTGLKNSIGKNNDINMHFRITKKAVLQEQVTPPRKGQHPRGKLEKVTRCPRTLDSPNQGKGTAFQFVFLFEMLAKVFVGE